MCRGDKAGSLPGAVRSTGWGPGIGAATGCGLKLALVLLDFEDQRILIPGPGNESFIWKKKKSVLGMHAKMCLKTIYLIQALQVMKKYRIQKVRRFVWGHFLALNWQSQDWNSVFLTRERAGPCPWCQVQVQQSAKTTMFRGNSKVKYLQIPISILLFSKENMGLRGKGTQGFCNLRRGL